MESNEIKFDRQKLEELVEEYNSAIDQGRNSFTFEGHELSVGYIKYLIEYLDDKLL